MDFKTSQKLFSIPRMRKYLNACAGDMRKTMQLYRYNLRLCQRFYGVLNLFEVMLRNAINEHYAVYYSDPDWIVNQADSGKLLEYNKDEIKQTEAGYRKRGIYNNDKMVALLISESSATESHITSQYASMVLVISVLPLLVVIIS